MTELNREALAAGEHSLGPVGELRLHPDLDALTLLAGQPGRAWALVTKFDQESVYLRELVSLLDGQGIEVEQIHPELTEAQRRLH